MACKIQATSRWQQRDIENPDSASIGSLQSDLVAAVQQTLSISYCIVSIQPLSLHQWEALSVYNLQRDLKNVSCFIQRETKKLSA